VDRSIPHAERRRRVVQLGYTHPPRVAGGLLRLARQVP